MTNLTLEAYQQVERDAARKESGRGFTIHAAITVVVCLGLIALNILVAPEFPWAIFPVAGMSIGLFAHWFFGVNHIDEFTRQNQGDIEREARRQAA